MIGTENKNTEFMKWYEPCHEKLGRFVASMIWEEEEARDIISETVLITLEKFDKVKNEESFLYFLFGVAIRLVRAKKRKSWRQILFGDEKWEVMEERERFENNSDEQDLYTLLQLLDGKSREAIVLFEISGFSIKEICEMQNSSLSAVKSRLSRARKTLKEAGESERKIIALKAI